jgi:hypothetical protein
MHNDAAHQRHDECLDDDISVAVLQWQLHSKCSIIVDVVECRGWSFDVQFQSKLIDFGLTEFVGLVERSEGLIDLESAEIILVVVKGD